MSYVEDVLELAKQRNPAEPEFIQAVEEVLDCLDPVLERRPEYKETRILERIIEPERVVMFRVPWMDDKGAVAIDYRPVHAYTLTNDVAYIEPKARVY